MPRSTRLRLSVLLAATATAVGGSLLPGAAGAADPPWTMVASGLDNPRLLSFDATGALYVAEAGTGGPSRAGACLPDPEGGPDVCFGRTGAITKIAHGTTSRVVRNLPSLAGPDGGGALGPADVQVSGDQFTVSIGLGHDPADRKKLPRAARFMATLSTGTVGSNGLTVLADLGAFEAAHNPDGVVPDTDPVGFQRHGGGYIVADAGGNDILRVGNHGGISTQAVFDATSVPNPFPPPDSVDMQAVPTSVVRGPDGAWYVSQLTGFPFPTGAAQIFRVVPGQAPTVYASGFTNITDLAWRGDTLYAVELSTVGLLNEPGLPSGALVKAVPGGDPVTVVDNLPAPYGVAIRAGSAYVTTCAVCANGGGVARVPLG